MALAVEAAGLVVLVALVTVLGQGMGGIPLFKVPHKGIGLVVAEQEEQLVELILLI